MGKIPYEQARTQDPDGQPLVSVVPDGDSDDTLSAGGAVLVDNTLNTAPGLNVYSDQATQGANDPLVRITVDNAAFAQPALYIIHEGTGGGAAAIKLQGPVPQIEMVESDQVSPAGKFEFLVNGNRWRLASRNTADTSFEDVLDVQQLRLGGEVRVLSGWLELDSGVSIRSGNGSPEGVITAPVSSTWHRKDGGAGTSFYVKETGVGNTGWVAK